MAGGTEQTEGVVLFDDPPSPSSATAIQLSGIYGTMDHCGRPLGDHNSPPHHYAGLGLLSKGLTRSEWMTIKCIHPPFNYLCNRSKARAFRCLVSTPRVPKLDEGEQE